MHLDDPEVYKNKVRSVIIVTTIVLYRFNTYVTLDKHKHIKSRVRGLRAPRKITWKLCKEYKIRYL